MPATLQFCKFAPLLDAFALEDGNSEVLCDANCDAYSFLCSMHLRLRMGTRKFYVMLTVMLAVMLTVYDTRSLGLA